VTIKLTYQEYALLPEGDRRELIEGDFDMTPAPGEKHQRLSRNLQFELHKFLDQNPVGELYDAPFDVILEECTVVQPDLLIVLENRRSRIVPEGLRGAPNFLVEIISPSARKRDTHLKRRLYEKFGVEEYWIVDPESETVEQLVAKQARFETRGVFSRSDTVSSTAVAGMHIDFSKVFK
jgi:Uma2 family endonuclease